MRAISLPSFFPNDLTVHTAIFSWCMRIRSLCLLAHTKRVITLTRSFLLPADMRVIPKRGPAVVVKFGPPDDSTTNGASSSRPSPEFEAALVAIFENVGLSIPTPVEDLACTSDSPRSVLRIHELL